MSSVQFVTRAEYEAFKESVAGVFDHLGDVVNTNGEVLRKVTGWVDGQRHTGAGRPRQDVLAERLQEELRVTLGERERQAERIREQDTSIRNLHLRLDEMLVTEDELRATIKKMTELPPPATPPRRKRVRPSRAKGKATKK